MLQLKIQILSCTLNIKLLYRSISEEIPDDYYTIEIGKAKLINEGKDLSIITYGMGVHWAKEMLIEFPEVSIRSS